MGRESEGGREGERVREGGRKRGCGREGEGEGGREREIEGEREEGKKLTRRKSIMTTNLVNKCLYTTSIRISNHNYMHTHTHNNKVDPPIKPTTLYILIMHNDQTLLKWMLHCSERMLCMALNRVTYVLIR